MVGSREGGEEGEGLTTKSAKGELGRKETTDYTDEHGY